MYLPKVTHVLLNDAQKEEKEIERNLTKQLKSDEEKALLEHFNAGLGKSVMEKLLDNCTLSQLKIIKSKNSIEELKELTEKHINKVNRIYWALIKTLLEPSQLIREANYRLSQSSNMKVTLKEVLKGLFTSHIIPNHNLTISDKAQTKGFEAFAREILSKHFKIGRMGKAQTVSILPLDSDITRFKAFSKEYNKLGINDELERIERVNLLKFKAHDSKQYRVGLIIETSLEEELTQWEETRVITPRVEKLLKDIKSIKDLEEKYSISIEGYKDINLEEIEDTKNP